MLRLFLVSFFQMGFLIQATTVLANNVHVILQVEKGQRISYDIEF